MGLLCLVYLICALRTNIVFLVIFFTLVLAFGFLSGAYWQLAQGNAVLGGKLVVVSESLRTAGPELSTDAFVLGWRCFHFRDLYGRVVDFSRADARRRRLPAPGPRR